GQVADVVPEQSGEHGRGEEFNPEVAGRELDAASTPAAAEDPVAENRQVVELADGLVAVAAAGAGPPQALLERHAVDANVEQAADQGAEDEDDRREGQRVLEGPAEECGDVGQVHTVRLGTDAAG